MCKAKDITAKGRICSCKVDFKMGLSSGKRQNNTLTDIEHRRMGMTNLCKRIIYPFNLLFIN